MSDNTIGFAVGGLVLGSVGLVDRVGLSDGQIVVGESEAGGSVGTPQLSIHIDLSLQ